MQAVRRKEGDASHLVDGDPNTYWHTVYSVTVAKYPHWIDFDCAEVKQSKDLLICHVRTAVTETSRIISYR